jgi:hypothetical protein
MPSGCARILMSSISITTFRLVGSGRDGEEAKPVNTIVNAVTVLDSDTLELAVGGSDPFFNSRSEQLATLAVLVCPGSEKKPSCSAAEKSRAAFSIWFRVEPGGDVCGMKR